MKRKNRSLLLGADGRPANQAEVLGQSLQELLSMFDNQGWMAIISLASPDRKDPNKTVVCSGFSQMARDNPEFVKHVLSSMLNQFNDPPAGQETNGDV